MSTCRNCHWCKPDTKKAWDRCSHPDTQFSDCHSNCNYNAAETSCAYFKQYVPTIAQKLGRSRVFLWGMLGLIALGTFFLVWATWDKRPAAIQLSPGQWECTDHITINGTRPVLVGKVIMAVPESHDECISYRRSRVE